MRIPFFRSRSGGEPEKGGPVEIAPSPPDPKLAAIRTRFLGRIRDDYAALVQYRGGQLPRNPELITVVHRLAGSAGMVGFMDVSAIAGNLDDELAEPGKDTGSALEELLSLLEKTMSGQ